MRENTSKYPNGLGLAKAAAGEKRRDGLSSQRYRNSFSLRCCRLARRFEIRYEDENVIERYEPNFYGDGLQYEIGGFVSKIKNSAGRHFELTPEECMRVVHAAEIFTNYKKQIERDGKFR